MDNEIQQVPNPFGKTISAQTEPPIAIGIEEARAVKEVEASMVIAKRFPRDQAQCMDNILKACMRPSLAEESQYAYPRGGMQVTGPSIRLAEALAQNWGNCITGLRELSRSDKSSTMESYCWDLETNYRVSKTFTVEHSRYSKAGGHKKLVDPRDIYEVVANYGSRRLRSVILAVIPKDVVQAAIKQCDVTTATTVDVSEKGIKTMTETFAGIGVSQEMITKRLGHRLDSISAAEMVSLRKIFASIRDEMSSIKDWFSATKNENETQSAKANEIFKTQSDYKPNVDSTGEIYDQKLHATGPEGQPVLNSDGTFRKRRQKGRTAGTVSRKELVNNDHDRVKESIQEQESVTKEECGKSHAPGTSQGDIITAIQSATTLDELSKQRDNIDFLDEKDSPLPGHEYVKKYNELTAKEQDIEE